MAFVYILYSGKADIYYVGSCLSIENRLHQHIYHDYLKSFTSRADDWEVFLTIENLEYKQARLIERHIKQMKSKKYYLGLKNYPELLNKLIAKYRLSDKGI